ncbi:MULTISPECIES: hypothetical protein [Burkholderia]|uniref:hypothetical protein n=1 Tax=Burkholderia TaxID=32008 RepID=UPI001E412CCD|nr:MULTISPECIES: hypothetical protein [unclassified Burkholderia]UEP31948.1 hypothetical protein LMA01_22465 [Burkholderia sp. B21-007]UEP45464.1 hypothetical protein LMA02_22315 [Burkholderia sp. B21-005]
MNILHLVSYFFGGAFLTNAVPHLVSGLRGEPFQTPFANPPGRGLSSSTVNVVWGVVNLATGYALLRGVGEFDLARAADVAALGLGVLAIGLFLARHFGALHGGNAPERP